MSFLEKCKEATSRWLSLLKLGEWRVRVEVKNLGVGYYAVTYPSYDYIEALIQFNDPAVCGPYDLEAVAAHEVCHLPMAEFSTEAGTPERRAEERVVERFSRAMLEILRGVAGRNLVALVPKLRAVVGASVRARRAIAAGRYRMDPKLLELLMSAGQMSGRDDVPEDVKELLMQLAAAAVTGEASGDVEPPAAEATPENTDAPPAVETMPTDDPPPPARKPAPSNPGLSAAARAALATAEREALEVAMTTSKRLALEKEALREALFRSAPDVFPEAMPKIRETYRKAPPDEVERYIAAERARHATPQGQPPPNGRARVSDGEPREPMPGGTQVKNDGGVVIRHGGRTVS